MKKYKLFNTQKGERGHYVVKYEDKMIGFGPYETFFFVDLKNLVYAFQNLVYTSMVVGKRYEECFIAEFTKETIITDLAEYLI